MHQSILVAIPYHPAKRYCLPQLMEAVNTLEKPKNCTVEVVMRWDNAEYGSENAVKRQREFFRTIALQNAFDWLYFMGADTIPPADVLPRLLAAAEQEHAKIMGAVYWGRHNAENGKPEGAVAWRHDLTQSAQSALFLNGYMPTGEPVAQVDGMGMDAVLIHRDVLEKISYLSWPQNDDDYPFYDKARGLGYPSFIHTGVQCKHYFNETGYTYRAKVVD